jgi:hypothetical protein
VQVIVQFHSPTCKQVQADVLDLLEEVRRGDAACKIGIGVVLDALRAAKLPTVDQSSCGNPGCTSRNAPPVRESLMENTTTARLVSSDTKQSIWQTRIALRRDVQLGQIAAINVSGYVPSFSRNGPALDVEHDLRDRHGAGGHGGHFRLRSHMSGCYQESMKTCFRFLLIAQRH